MRINLSQKFAVKPKGAECAKIIFSEHEITSVAAFLFECCSGRAVCPLFKKEDGAKLLRIAEKRDERFIKSHTIFLDFDNEQQTPQELISKVDGDIQASCAFSSYSDSQEKRKYHLFWLFQSPLNKEQHKLISTFLFEKHKPIASFEDSIDPCSVKTSQMCFGTSNPLYIFNNNEKIFNGAEDFFQMEEFQQWALEREQVEQCSSTEEKHAQKAKNEGCNAFINYAMCNDYENKPWNEFAEKWSDYSKGWVNFRLEHEGWNFSPISQTAYQHVDEKKYFQMPYIIHRGHYNNMSSETIKHWLLQTMSCFKLLNPRCDLNRILYRVLQKIELQNIDPDKTLNARDLVSVMEEVSTYTEEDIEEKFSSRLAFLRKTSKLKSGIIIKKNLDNKNVGYSTLLSQIKKELVLSVVSGQETPKEAFAIVSEKFPRLDISLTWVQNFYSEMGFCSEQKMTKIGMQMKAIKGIIAQYGLKSENNENGLNQLQLLSMLEKQGMKISRGTLQNRLKELENLTI
jgi:hypothetical protein|nr:MAG TPA: Putative iron uptake regulatory protein, nickel-uptake regulator, D-domain, dimerization [Caudoviricetes sp.]